VQNAKSCLWVFLNIYFTTYLFAICARNYIKLPAIKIQHNEIFKFGCWQKQLRATTLKQAVKIAHDFENIYWGTDKSLARLSSRCILFDGENNSFDASLVICIYK
jgi:hypothetical protein